MLVYRISQPAGLAPNDIEALEKFNVTGLEETGNEDAFVGAKCKFSYHFMS